MPNWLKSQMQRAFYEKDHYQIKLLNQCWYFYRKNTADRQCSSEPERNFFCFLIIFTGPFIISHNGARYSPNGADRPISGSMGE
ncbi:hypothetical protein BVL54_18815 [Bacillus paralicheniformis]|nr:hypothetical protein BVL54_18815 [Bacillus paralicheniformis]